MMNWALVAGGHSAKQPWCVQVAGYCLRDQQAFLLSDAQWAALEQELPLQPLLAYGQSGAMTCVRALDMTGPCDGVLLIVHQTENQPALTLPAETQRYLLLRQEQQLRQVDDENAFSRIFVPSKEQAQQHPRVYIDSLKVPETDPAGGQTWPIERDAQDRDYARNYHCSADYWLFKITTSIAEAAAQAIEAQPLLSVIVPTYNYGRYLAQCIQSVLEQCIDDIEILVLDNASTDETPQVMAAFSDHPNVRYIRNRYNYGPGYNWRNGLRIAQGRYFTFLSADDYYNPGHLSRLLNALERHPHSAVGYTGIRWVDEAGHALNQPRHPGYRHGDYVGERNEVADLLIHDSYMTPSAVIFRREAFLQTWNPGNTYGAGDWEMVVQMAERYPDFIYMDNPGVSYRWHGSQYSTQFYTSTEPLLGHLAIVEGVFERNAQHHLRGREREVAAHLRRRLELYPDEHDTALGARARKLCEHLELQARQQERALFSIILTTYNRPQLLRDALNSIAEQSLRDFDVILVNDNGDPVESLLADYDFPITYLRQGRNRGPAAARNAALRLARGHHVVFLDDDDLYLPDHLAHLAKGLEANPGCVVYTDAVFIQEQITAGQRQELAREQRYPHEQYAREQLLINNYIPINTFACPRDLALAAGDFDETLAGLEDWDFLLRLCARSVFHHLPHETVQVRMRTDSQAPARRSEQAFKDYPSLYRELYARHIDGGSEQVKRGRQEMLDLLSGKSSPSTLQTWLAERVPGPLQRRLIEQRLDEHGGGPMIGVVVVDAEGQAEAVNTTLQSLSSQHCLYAKVKVIVLTAAELSSMPVHSGVQLARLSEESLGVQLNPLVEAGKFDWFMRVDAGSEFTPSGLLIAALDLLAAPECRAVYADEGLRGDGAEMGAALRPDLNLDLLLSLPASMARHWLFNRQVWLEMGGFEQQAGKAFELAYILRLIEGQGFAGLGHISEPLLIGEAPSLYDCPDQRGVIVRHLQARGFAQARVESPLPGRYALEYGAPDDIPVSIMIVVQGTGTERAQRCVESILEKTTHRSYEVLLVAPVKADAAVDGWLNAVSQLGADAIRCLRLATGLSPAQMRNQAASQARGDFLLWLDEGAAVLDGDWLQQLLNHGMRQEVGVVGAKLVAGDATIRHAGYVLGLNGPVGEAFAGMPLDAPGYLQRLQVDQNYSAVSGKCLLVNKGLFLEVGGFDETPALQRWLDVDLCLRLRSAGYLSVWTPRAQLLLSEDVASAPSVEQEDALYARWLPALATDPFHNPNFSLSSTNGFALAPNALSWRPLASWKPLPMILAHAADRFGCGHYRVIQPLEALTRDGLAEGVLSWNHLSPAELERCRPDSIVLQRQVGDEQIEHMRRMHAFSQAFKVFELDDYLPNLPLKSVHRAHMPKDILRSLRRGLAYVDRFVVSTEPLAEAFAGLHGDVRVVPNTLEPRIWSGLVALRRQSRKPRVGWAGGAGHTGDLEVIADVVKALANEVEWVFFGLCPAVLRPYIHEYYENVPIDRYPATLARMNLDLALAPVEQNLFNACKSNLRLLEYGACGFPVIASDVRCYQGFDDLPVTLVKNRFRAWVDAIRLHIADLDATAKVGDDLRKAVLDGWMLEGDRLVDWRRAWLPD